ncbi:MAG: ABC transporter permease [Gemmatimonadota bacterium]|nr:ABC transporter permease [Gemmatimonadota bacterium]
MDAELRFHLDARTEELMAGGLTRGDARARALAEFGDVDAARAELTEIDRRMARRHTRADWWEAIAQDLRHTVRGLARAPGFTAMVVVTLALGIGANAAVFSVLNRLFLAYPAGVSQPEQVHRLVVHATYPASGKAYTRGVLSYQEYKALTEAVTGVPLAAWGYDQEHLGTGPGAPSVNVTLVAGDYFGVLGVRAAHGRVFRPDEWQVGTRTPVAVISDAMWHARFGGDPAIVGRTVALGVHEYTIIGVAPPGFRGTDLNAADLWVPLNSEGSWKPGGFSLVNSEYTAFLQPLLRVASAADEARAMGEATPVFRHSQMARDSLATVSLPGAAGVSQEFIRDRGAIVTRLAGVAAIILLLACANVANLQLTRGMQRRREIAIRLALGVSRRRLVGQLLLESAVVAAIAGAAALLVAVWGAGALRHALVPENVWGTPAVGTRVAWFTAGVAAFAALAAGLIPALQSANPDLNAALKSGGLGGSAPRSRTRAVLIAAQAALAVVLLGGAGLFVRSLRAVQGIDVGYATNRMVVASAGYDVDAAPADAPARSQLLERVAERLRHAPGVEALGMTENPTMQSISIMTLHLPGRDSVPKLDGAPPLSQFVSPGFFEASGIPLLAGRRFTDADRKGAEPVVIVSESMARLFWPHANAVGQCVIVGKPGDACRRVVGVVADEHVVNIVEPTMMNLFIPLAQSPSGTAAGQIVIGAAPQQVNAVVREARREIADVFGAGAIPKVQAMRDVLDPQLRPWRLGAVLFSGAGLLALLVAAVGVYSGMSYGVSLRRREIGIRLALGARRGGIVRLVIGQGVRVAVMGAVAGVIAALALGHLVASLLYGVTPHDPAVLAATAATLVLVAGAACFVPARRAARVDPMETLRAE